MKLINKTRSLCPECMEIISANIIEENGKIYIEKECVKDGFFKDVYFGQADIYYKFMNHLHNGKNNLRADSEVKSNCIADYELCGGQKSSTILGNIDITNLCNYSCPICFANAQKSGYKIHPSIDEISEMMDALRNQKSPCSVIQFSGGEPTTRKDLFEIAKIAHEKGFVQIQIATNGRILAKDKDFARKLWKAHVDTVYLQFDGVTPEPYIEARGFNALPEKITAIENLRKNGKIPNAVLVPTLVKGVNDHQIGNIVRFALKNIDVVRGIVFQPVAFTGRIDKNELLSRRFTITDFISSIENQLGGQISKEDFFPIPIVTPIFDYLKMNDNTGSLPEVNTHPACGAWTYVFKDGDKFIPLNKIISFEAVFSVIKNLKSTSKMEMMAEITKKLPKLIRIGSFQYSHKIISLIKDIIFMGGHKALAEFHDNNVLFIGSMHFMDPYNFDCERLERCCIHYATLDNKIVPFCSYNNIHRRQVENDYINKHNDSRPS